MAVTPNDNAVIDYATIQAIITELSSLRSTVDSLSATSALTIDNAAGTNSVSTVTSQIKKATTIKSTTITFTFEKLKTVEWFGMMPYAAAKTGWSYVVTKISGNVVTVVVDPAGLPKITGAQAWGYATGVQA
jgi:hypothetical protein